MPAPLRSSSPERDRGFALILVLIFTVLLYALIAELVTTARTDRLTGENDALLTRMHRHMEYTLTQVEEQLLTDLQAAAASEDGGGGMPGAGPGAQPGADPGAEGEEEEPDPAALADCSQDAWYEPTAYSDGELTTYVWVEDENRKFNLLTLVSPDEKFKYESRQRFVRLIDLFREDTQFDLTTADGEMFADRIIDWIERRLDIESMPKPPLKSDDDERPGVSLPLHLDELLLLEDIDEDLLFDKVLDSRIIPGLESLLTIYTSMRFDPGNPDAPPPDPGASGESPSGTPPEPAPQPEPDQPGAPPPQPEGLGIRININTAPAAVLYCLFPTSEIPDHVIEAVLRWRNEPIEEEEDPMADVPEDYLGDISEGYSVKRQVFTEVEQLDEIPEWKNLPDPAIKQRFYDLVTTKSDVFSIHMASMYKRNEETRVFVMRRLRTIVMRLEDEEDGKLHPLILHEERHGLRVMPVDYPDEEADEAAYFDSMDDYAQEERAWNPFYLDFYRPQYERERLFTYTDRR